MADKDNLARGTGAPGVGTLDKPSDAAAKGRAEFKDGFYWFGMLPAQGMVEWARTVPQPGPTGEWLEKFMVSAADMWRAQNRGDQETYPIFVGKCRHWSDLGVTGCSFPAYSQARLWQDGDTTTPAFAGNGNFYYADEARAVVASCYDHYVHCSKGIDKLNTLGHRDVSIRKKSQGAKPRQMTEEEWREYRIERSVDVFPPFDPRFDVEIAHLVYFIHKPEVDVHAWPRDEYENNANSFHVRVLPPVDERFFASPPPSVAELYPQTPKLGA